MCLRERATNGKIYSQELVDCVRRLWEKEQSYGDQFISPVKWVLTHADDEEEYSFFNIAVSGDRYHEDILAANMLRYYRCGFFSKMKMQNEKREYILCLLYTSNRLENILSGSQVHFLQVFIQLGSGTKPVLKHGAKALHYIITVRQTRPLNHIVDDKHGCVIN